MKIYTRRGDEGETDLFGGGRVPKDSLRVDAYGTVDELNAVLGGAVTELNGSSDQDDAKEGGELKELLRSVQSDLFKIGAELASVPEAVSGKLQQRTTPITEERIAELELAIDRYEEQLEPLRNFILPGGCEAASRLHVSRTVCRRAERRIVALTRQENISPEIVKYINRLSDLLFVLARVTNQRAGVTDVPWNG